MKIINTVHTMELTTKEIELITSALHDKYMKYSSLNERDLVENHDNLYGKYYDEMNQARDLRNVFAKIINTTYAGKDA